MAQGRGRTGVESLGSAPALKLELGSEPEGVLESVLPGGEHLVEGKVECTLDGEAAPAGTADHGERRSGAGGDRLHFRAASGVVAHQDAARILAEDEEVLPTLGLDAHDRADAGGRALGEGHGQSALGNVVGRGEDAGANQLPNGGLDGLLPGDVEPRHRAEVTTELAEEVLGSARLTGTGAEQRDLVSLVHEGGGNDA